MRRRVLLPSLLAALVLSVPGPTWAGDMKNLVPNLFGANGILLAPPAGGFSHAPHFLVNSREELTALNDALLGQLVNVPLPSPASGFTFELDPALGVLKRSTESFGPIYADRAETIGRNKLSLGFSYSRFAFDSLDGKDLGNGEVALTFHHEPTGGERGLPPFFFERDTVTGRISADITEELFVFNATYGILDNLDVSIAIPIIRLQMDVRGVATINHIGTTPQQGIHRFADGSDTLTVHASDEATGIGDIVLRGKYNFLRLKPVSLAAGLDLRLPTGDEDNLLGLGTTRVRPFFVASATTPWDISPHVNVGFDLGDTSKLDDEFFYKVGFDWAATKWATFAFDVLGRYIIDNSRLQPNGQPADNNIVDASIGFKVNLWRNLLILANVLVPLNSTGLRADAVPFVGVEWTF